MTSGAAPVAGKVLVMGAGAVGCWVGGHLARAGVAVDFVGRPRMLAALATQGLTLTDLQGRRDHLPASSLRLHATLPADSTPALVLLCVKSGATAQAAAELGHALPPGTPVLSLQNGVCNVAIAQAAAPGLELLAGMVAFNVAEVAPGQVHRGTSGELVAQDGPVLRGWAPTFAAAGVPLRLRSDMLEVQWGKLLLNLNNPVNALSGLPLKAQLLDRDHRRVTAALQDEALRALRAARIRPVAATPVPPRWMPLMLRLPTALFRRVAARSLQMDERARSSMADDLARGRTTEIDALCGEVVRLGAAHGVATPCNQRMLDLVRERAADAAPYRGAALLRAIGAG